MRARSCANMRKCSCQRASALARPQAGVLRTRARTLTRPRASAHTPARQHAHARVLGCQRAHTSACWRRMEEKVQKDVPKRWEMYVKKRRGNEDVGPDADPIPTGGSANGGPASSTQTVRDPPHERGNEDQTSDTGITSTGDPVTGGWASSTQRTRGPPQERDDPRDDDAYYLFGPDGEGKMQHWDPWWHVIPRRVLVLPEGPGTGRQCRTEAGWWRESAQSTCVRSSRLHA